MTYFDKEGKMPEEQNKRIGEYIGVAYIVLMALHICLPSCKLYVEDLLFPVMLGMIAVAWKRLPWRDKAFVLLGAFLLYSGISSIIHVLLDGFTFQNIISHSYEWCVFFYGAVVFVFFACYPISSGTMRRLGAVLLVALFTTWCLDGVRYAICHDCSPWFGMLYGQMEGSSMSFLSRRFSFTFDNPNLAGSFAALAYALPAIVLGGEIRGRRIGTKAVWGCFLLMCACMVPLFFSMSKHGLLCVGVMCGFAGECISSGFPRLHRLCWIPILAAGLLFETTVLFTSFPISGEAPFINTTPGMYSIHQAAYLRMLKANMSPLGVGTLTARKEYHNYVDRESAAKTLSFYNASKDLDSFCAYMDAHCEYLNIAALFGWPALILIVMFLLELRKKGRIAAYFIMALLFCMLWDDILSKRWIWTSAGVLFAYSGNEKKTLQEKTK